MYSIENIKSLYKKGDIHDGIKMCISYIEKYGSNERVRHLIAAGYFAIKFYHKAWFWIKVNPDSTLKSKIERKVGA